jgi:hypothetical protein
MTRIIIKRGVQGGETLPAPNKDAFGQSFSKIQTCAFLNPVAVSRVQRTSSNPLSNTLLIILVKLLPLLKVSESIRQRSSAPNKLLSRFFQSPLEGILLQPFINGLGDPLSEIL